MSQPKPPSGEKRPWILLSTRSRILGFRFLAFGRSERSHQADQRRELFHEL
jgi:hypothetical protein